MGEIGDYVDEDEHDDEHDEEHEFGVLEEDSPRQDTSYLSSGLSNVTSMASGGMSMGMGGPLTGGMAMAAPSQLIQAQHLLQGQM